MKNRKPLKTSFVVTFAGAAGLLLAAPGCNGDIITNPPFVDEACPELAPSNGDPCDESLTKDVCEYPAADPCDSSRTATCEDSKWVVSIDETVSCNPPPLLDCPETMPATGDDCFGEGSCEYIGVCDIVFVATCPPETNTFLVTTDAPPCNPPPVLACPDTIPSAGGDCFGEGECVYEDECGEPITVTCPAGVYEIDQDVTCNPPPPCDFWTDVESCSSFATCRWLEPGCDAGPVGITAGCYPAAPCANDAECSPAQACQTVGVVPACDGPDCPCSESTTVCLPAQ